MSEESSGRDQKIGSSAQALAEEGRAKKEPHTTCCSVQHIVSERERERKREKLKCKNEAIVCGQTTSDEDKSVELGEEDDAKQRGGDSGAEVISSVHLALTTTTTAKKREQ